MFSNETVVITGGTSGIGLSIAERLSNAGARCVLIGRNEAKAGLHALTQHLAMELGEQKIRVNAVAPAVVETPVYESFIPKEQVAEVLSGFNAFHPIGRVGTPDDVASAVEYLLSDNASWITGTVLNVDGGVMAGRN